jgi:hypothetical protein
VLRAVVCSSCIDLHPSHLLFVVLAFLTGARRWLSDVRHVLSSRGQNQSSRRSTILGFCPGELEAVVGNSLLDERLRFCPFCPFCPLGMTHQIPNCVDKTFPCFRTQAHRDRCRQPSLRTTYDLCLTTELSKSGVRRNSITEGPRTQAGGSYSFPCPSRASADPFPFEMSVLGHLSKDSSLPPCSLCPPW